MAIRRIQPEEVLHFSIDEEKNFLYWDDRLIHTTETVLHLSNRQELIAIAVAIFTLISAGSTAVYTGYYVADHYASKNEKKVTVSISEVASELKVLADKIPRNSGPASSSGPVEIDPEIKRSLTNIAASLQVIQGKLTNAAPPPSQRSPARRK